MEEKKMMMMRGFWRRVYLFVTVIAFLISLSLPAFGQANNALQFSADIFIPNWTTGGITAGNFDALWFNPQNGVVYIADRINDGATAVDTRTWTVLGTSVPPGCGVQTLTGAASGNCRPSGILVAPDLQKLVFTARGPTASNPNAPPAGLWIFDLRAPASAPVLVQTPAGPDFVDYNPINHFIYLKTSPTGAAGDTIVVIDLVNGNIVTQIPIGKTIEQPKLNPVDGLLYVAVTTSGQQGMAKIDPNTNTIVGTTFSLATANVTCTPHQFDIDPVTDVAVIGCSEAAVSMDLHNGNILSTYPLQVNTDTTGFNLNLHHLYVTSTTGSTNSGCPKSSAGTWPAIGVVSTSAPTPGQFVGLGCGGRGEKGAAADPLNHNVYVATPQYPVDPNSATTGQAGLLVFHGPGAIVTGTPPNTEQASSQAALTALGGSGISGSVIFTLRRRSMFVDANLTGAKPGSTLTDLLITTTAGDEVVHCGVDGAGRGFCQGRLYGDPLIGGVVDVGSERKLAASGSITLGSTVPTFISTDSMEPVE